MKSLWSKLKLTSMFTSHLQLCSTPIHLTRTTTTTPQTNSQKPQYFTYSKTKTMGSRLSQPRGPAGTTESSHPVSAPPPPTPAHPLPRRRPFTARQAMAPAAAFTMACILFVYSTTSIRAAKENARRYRERDTGGEGLSLLEESRRRHGLVGRREGERGVVGELAGQLFGREEEGVGEGGRGKGRSEEEERLRLLGGKK